MEADEILVELSAPANLRNRVLALWVHRSKRALTRRVVPDGSAHILCRVGSSAEIHRLTRPATEEIAAGSLVVGARLRPDALWQSWQPRELEHLGDALADLSTAQSALRAFAQFLSNTSLIRPANDRVATWSVDALLADPRVTVDQLVGQTSLSARQWRRRFVAATGVSPKLLQRQLRFQLLLGQIQSALYNPDQQSLAEIAIRTGYFDQSHLANECRQLTGRPLGLFVRETKARCREHHDHTAAFSHISTTALLGGTARL